MLLIEDDRDVLNAPRHWSIRARERCMTACTFLTPLIVVASVFTLVSIDWKSLLGVDEVVHECSQAQDQLRGAQHSLTECIKVGKALLAYVERLHEFQ